MKLVDAIQQRRTVRGFTDQIIDDDTLNRLFTQAQQAPSNCNTQSWKAYVVNGERCRQLADSLYLHVSKGNAPSPDFGFMPTYEGIYRDRQVVCAHTLYSNINIARDDKPARMAALLQNYQLFGAPHVVFIGMPKSYGIVNAVDIGIYVQNLLLVMTSMGIASCPQGALGYYPLVVREHLDIDDEIGILLGISFGYEDTEILF